MMLEIDNSHFWSSIEMFLNWMNAIDQGFLEKQWTKDYIKMGFENALKHGYDLRKENNESNQRILAIKRQIK